MKPIKFNPNDPKLWKDFDLTEKNTDFIDNKSESRVNRSRANKLKAQDLAWIENQKEGSRIKSKDPIYKDKISTILKNRTQDPKWRKKISDMVSKRSEDSEYIKKLSDAKKGKKMNEIHYKNYRESRKALIKPIVTPDGPMRSRRDAATFYNVDITTIGTWLHKKSNQFYYISQEEYIMLTGKDI